MRADEFPLELEPAARTPVFVQIARAVAREVARGRLRPGDALPGTRTLAGSLGVHRSTVVAAYAELTAQGWIAARPGGSTVITASAADSSPRRLARKLPRSAVPEQPGFFVAPAPLPAAPNPSVPRGTLMMWGGVPDLRLVPLDLLARAYRRVARRCGRELLGYAPDAMGHHSLRRAVAGLVSSTRALSADLNSVLITRGSQMALELVARSLIEPGDAVAVEALCYPSGVNVFRRAGAKLVPVAVDQDGIDVAALAAISQKQRLRAVYVTPHHQYPTTVMLSPTRRLQLLELARRERIAIVEDDYDQEFHYDGRPVSPLASSDGSGNVIYVGTLAKVLAPGLRLGFVVAPRSLLERMTAERTLIDRQGDALLECAVAELIEDGELQRHARRARRIYHSRRDALCAALDASLRAVSYTRPAGGLALWARVDPGVDLERWQRRAVEEGVFFQIGRQFTLDGSAVPAIRLGYASLDEKTLHTAVRRIVKSLPVRARKRGC
jgi:GntR family transcriptional regulator/MocR family aminotransferase